MCDGYMHTLAHTTQPSKPHTQWRLSKSAASGREPKARGSDTLAGPGALRFSGGSAHLRILLGDEVHKAETPVSACPCHLLWQAHSLQFPEGARDKRQTAKIKD